MRSTGSALLRRDGPGRQARPGRIEAARAKAAAARDPSYRAVRGILAAGTERDQLPSAAADGGATAFLLGSLTWPATLILHDSGSASSRRAG